MGAKEEPYIDVASCVRRLAVCRVRVLSTNVPGGAAMESLLLASAVFKKSLSSVTAGWLREFVEPCVIMLQWFPIQYSAERLRSDEFMHRLPSFGPVASAAHPLATPRCQYYCPSSGKHLQEQVHGARFGG